MVSKGQDTSKQFGNTRVAVVGAGYWGQNLIRNFFQLGVLKAICDENASVLAEFAKKYEIETCPSPSELFGREDIQGIVITTPAEAHYALAREALLSGKHVFVEKPMVTRESEAEDLIAIAEKKKRILMVGHLLQYHPVFVCLKELVRAGDLGRINYIYSHRLNLGKIRREENILWSFAPHDISMILSLAGDFPEALLTTGGYYLHKQIADVTTTHIEFSSGLKAHIFVSWLHPFKDQKLVVVGDRKMAVFDDTQPWPDKLLLYPHQIKWENNLPVPSKGKPERAEVMESEPLRLECLQFLECMISGHPPITDGNEGLRVLKVLKASQQSLDAEGRKVHFSKYTSFETDQAKEKKGRTHFYAHETAIVDEGVEIGKETKIWQFTHVLRNSKIGENGNIGQNVVIGPDVLIGRNCRIQNNVSVYKGVTLEDEVFCGPSMVFTNVFNPRSEIKKMDELRPTLIRKGATLGANSTIVCGTTVGRYAFVGAGAVVTRDVPDYALVVGNPARRTGWVCRCGEKLTEKLNCMNCRRKYIKDGRRIKEKAS